MVVIYLNCTPPTTPTFKQYIYFLLPLGYFLLSEVVYSQPRKLFSSSSSSSSFYFSGSGGFWLCQQKTYNSPGADTANGVEADSCINHRVRGANRWRRTTHAAGQEREHHISHGSQRCPPPTPPPPPSLHLQGLPQQHRKGPSGIHAAVIHIWHVAKRFRAAAAAFSQACCKGHRFTAQLPFRKIKDKRKTTTNPVNISRPATEQEA